MIPGFNYFFQLTNQILVQVDGYESTHLQQEIASGNSTFAWWGDLGGSVS